MDITPIFRPPTPPQGGLLFFIGLVSSLTIQAKDPVRPENTQAPFVLFYQPLTRLPDAKAKAYIQKLRGIFQSNEEVAVEKLLVAQPNSRKCQRQQLWTCAKALFLHARCVPKKQHPSRFCPRHTPPIPSNHFKEPLFNRLEWNQWALRVNYHCNTQPASVCQRLSELHNQVMRNQ
jgi:hypothetical protein